MRGRRNNRARSARKRVVVTVVGERILDPAGYQSWMLEDHEWRGAIMIKAYARLPGHEPVVFQQALRLTQMPGTGGLQQLQERERPQRVYVGQGPDAPTGYRLRACEAAARSAIKRIGDWLARYVYEGYYLDGDDCLTRRQRAIEAFLRADSYRGADVGDYPALASPEAREELAQAQALQVLASG